MSKRTLRYGEEGRTLLIRMPRDWSVYGLEIVPCDFPGTVAVKLTKLGGDKAAYFVTCGPGGEASCECLGHLRWGTECKHIGAVKKLIELKRLK